MFRAKHYPKGQMELDAQNNQQKCREVDYGQKPPWGKSSTENTMHVALWAINIWINPSGEDRCLNLYLTQHLDQCLLMRCRWCQKTPNGDMSLSALELPQNLIVLSSECSLVTSFTKGLATVGGYCRTTLPPQMTYWTFWVPISSGSRLNINEDWIV